MKAQGRLAIRAASLLFVTAGLAIAGPARAADPAGPGPYSVGFTIEVVFDATRNLDSDFGARPVTIAMFYPVDADTVAAGWPTARYPRNPVWAPGGPVFLSDDFEQYGIDAAFQEPPASTAAPFPVVVLSPGLAHQYFQQLYMATRLASHGFVAAIVGHYGVGAFPQDPLFHLADAIMNRPPDLSFALDRLLARNATAGDLLEDVLDSSRVAAGGHSLGGYAAIALASGDDVACDAVDAPPAYTCVPVAPDSRFRVLLLLDASSWALWYDELERVRVPTIELGQSWATLLATGDEEGAAWHAREHAAFSGHPNLRVDFERSTHGGSFSNLCETIQVRADLGLIPSVEAVPNWFGAGCANPDVLPSSVAHELVTRYAVAFLKTNLAGEAGYQRILTPGADLTTQGATQLFVTERRAGGPPESDWPGTFWYFTTQPGSDRANALKDSPALRAIGVGAEN